MRLDPRTEDQLRLLCEGRNRAICDILTEETEPVHVEELAERLVTRDVTVVSSAVYDDKIDDVRLELHHERLPKLAEVDLVEYDRGENLVTPKSPLVSTVEWEDGTNLTDLVTYLRTVRQGDASGIGVIEGRESVFEYGRKLADEAEEELFTIYASTDLLEDECATYGENALARGVTLCVGSQSETVRELCRENLPGATVWEPRLDWLNTPTYPRVGRLLFMDRRKVMLSVLEEPPSEGEPPEEVALVGSGEENPLVVLVRELLGPRLDHLDYQSDDFRNRLHP